MATNYNPRTVTNDLTLCLDAGNKKSYSGSGTTWIDLSGKRYDGTLASGPTYDNSGSIVFDGTDDHIACSVIPRSTSMSLEVWFNASSVSAARQYLYTQQRDTPVLALYAYQERQGCQLELNRAAFQYFNDVNNSFIVTTDAIIQPNTWYQFVATLNGSSYQLYLNGLPTNMNPNTTDNSFLSTNPQSKTFTPNEAFIARRADGQGEDRFTGKIAIVKEYSRALTADEVRQNFNALRNRFGI
ncbi:MAG: LamG domain-containing protein [Candidatus Nanopelagicaceae bacterium]